MRWRRRWAALTAAVILPVAALTACSSGDSGEGPAAVRSELPAKVRDSGRLVIGTSSPFPPMEFRDGNDRLTGFDVDLLEAIAAELGVQTDFQQGPFPELLPGVVGGEYDLAVRGLFDTVARQQQVDMVTYFSAGTQWAARIGATVDPADSCGMRVGAERGTVQFTTELPAKSTACTDVGEEAIEIVGFDTIAQAVEALADQQVDAVSADSPAILYLARTSQDRVAPVGAAFDTAPYGLAVAKGSSLGPVLQQSVQRLIDDGELAQIAQKWGLEGGLITTSLINGATS
ncbi:ABC transporter substrate-binding protein [Gordonia hirsuta]|nr:ABC transporter substrate-binding protein [Gordonia hirsuta]